MRSLHLAAVVLAVAAIWVAMQNNDMETALLALAALLGGYNIVNGGSDS